MLLCFLYYFLSFPCVIQKLVFQHQDVMSQNLINIHGLYENMMGRVLTQPRMSILPSSTFASQ